MERSLVILSIATGIYAAVMLLLVSQYLETRFRYVAWWTAGAAALTARAVVEILILSAPGVIPLVGISGVLLLAGAGFFLTGAVARDPRARGIVMAGFLGFGALVGAAVILLARQGDVGTARLIAGLGAGAAFALAAYSFLRAEQVLDDLAARLIFAGLLAMGANLLGWSLISRAPVGAVDSEFTGGLCVLVFGAGIELRALQRERRLVVLSQISAILSRSQQVASLLEDVLHRAGELLQLHTGWVFLRQPPNGAYDLAAAYHLPASLEQDDRAAMRGPCRCLDLLHANQLTQPVNIVDCMRLAKVGIKAQHASVPLRSATGIAGLMNLVLPAGRLFSQRELALLATVGGEVGLAVEKAQLLDELKDKERARSDLIKKLLTAHEDERRRIARELHDETGQSLTALILNVQMLRGLTEQGTQPTEAALERLQDLAEATLEEVRNLIYDLRPTILDDLGLTAALRWYVHAQLEPRGLSVDLQLPRGETRLDPMLETAVFRIAQEALWNVVKHAGATRVQVALAVGEGRAVLRIKDDGRGFQTNASQAADPRRGGLGITGMRERATLIGGTLSIASAPDAGTEIIAEFPLPAPPSD